MTSGGGISRQLPRLILGRVVGARTRRVIVLGVLVVGAGIGVHLAGWDNVRVMRALASGRGVVGLSLFVLGYAGLTLTPAPKGALSVAAGLIFGFGTGLTVVLAGASIGALVAFGLARLLGRGRDRMTGSRMSRLNALVERRGLVGVLVLRLIPVVPFTAINYGSGFTSLRVRDYALGTVVGIVPGSAAYVAVGAGSAASHGRLLGAVGAVALLALTVVGVLVGRGRATAG